MAVLGVRCSNRDFSYAILEGSKAAPILVDYATIQFPKGFSTPDKLKWFMRELEDLIRKHSVVVITLKGTEGLAARGKPFVERVECEAIVFLVGALAGIKRIQRKVKSSMAKDLGFKGKGRYLSTKLDTSIISDFDDFSTKIQEAILAGWSDLA